MCDFKPGDEVVCVDAQVRHAVGAYPTCPVLIEGAVYTVRAVFLDARATPRVHLHGASNTHPIHGTDGGFYASRFRKAQRPRTRRSLTEWLNQPTTFEGPHVPARKRERA